MIINSKSAKDTEKLAKYLAGKILAGGAHKNAVVVSLVGELGAGKTHFTKAFMKALGIKETIQSPTFNIMKIYAIETRDKRQETIDGKEKQSKETRLLRGARNDSTQEFRSAYHIDAYRIKSKDLLALGWKEIVKDPANIILVEWADIVKDILPKDAINIEIKHADKEGERRIILS